VALDRRQDEVRERDGGEAGGQESGPAAAEPGAQDDGQEEERSHERRAAQQKRAITATATDATATPYLDTAGTFRRSEMSRLDGGITEESRNAETGEAWQSSEECRDEEVRTCCDRRCTR
jgi:hypothetical protein